jgi:Chromo (CHRromatin Organisation MOdifier) domain
MGLEKGMRLELEKILARTITKRNNEPVVQILIKWVYTSGEDSTWEDYELGTRMLLRKGNVSG